MWIPWRMSIFDARMLEIYVCFCAWGTCILWWPSWRWGWWLGNRQGRQTPLRRTMGAALSRIIHLHCTNNQVIMLVIINPHPQQNISVFYSMMSDLAPGSLSSLIYLDLGRQRGVWLLTNTRQIAHSTTTLYMVRWPYICGGRPGVFSQKKLSLVSWLTGYW